jgi:HlyD family secretion protein
MVEEDLTLGETNRHAFVNRNGIAERVAVQVGLSDDTYQEVVSGVSEGDAVIVGPDRVLRALEDGDRVVVGQSGG